MNIDYEPWAASHAPQRFSRTDTTGRWSPIEDGYKPAPEPKWMAMLGGAALVCFFALCISALMLFWGMR